MHQRPAHSGEDPVRRYLERDQFACAHSAGGPRGRALVSVQNYYNVMFHHGASQYWEDTENVLDECELREWAFVAWEPMGIGCGIPQCRRPRAVSASGARADQWNRRKARRDATRGKAGCGSIKIEAGHRYPRHEQSRPSRSQYGRDAIVGDGGLWCRLVDST